MEDFSKCKLVEFPRNVLAGHGVIARVKEVCSSIHSGNVGTIITGENTLKAAGKDVLSYMDGYQVDTCVVGDATMENIQMAEAQVKEFGSSFILAVGGGSKIDLAKMVSKDLNLPFISIPTSASHDGIASNRASLKSEHGSRSVESASPMGIIADTAVISKAPYRLLASGCADVISNLTALKDWDYARRLRNVEFSRSAYALSKFSAQCIIDDSEMIRPHSEESTWLAIKPIILSGTSMCIARSSRPTSGAEHMISHTIDVRYPGRALHGEQCGVASIMMMYIYGGDWKTMRHALENIGAPTTARELGLKDEEILDAMVNAHKIRTDRFTILGDNGIDYEAAECAAKETGVI
jgi:glycerol-1-phosphate dehydrogenase [NAD(P)+]